MKKSSRVEAAWVEAGRVKLAARAAENKAWTAYAEAAEARAAYAAAREAKAKQGGNKKRGKI